MAAKRFGALDLAAGVDTVLMEGQTGYDSTVNVRFVNRNGSSVAIRLALVDAPALTALANLADEDYLEYDYNLMANCVIENTGIAVPAGFSLVARSDTDDVTVVAFGFEELLV